MLEGTAPSRLAAPPDAGYNAGGSALLAADAQRRENAVYKRVLVPLDGSSLAEGVLPQAAALARRFQAEVILLQVVPPLSKMVAETMPAAIEPSGTAAVIGVKAAEEKHQRLREQALAYLAGVRRRLRGVRSTLQVVEGSPGERIVAYAGEQGVDLIAMSTHGRRGLARLVLGSVAEYVLRHSRTPLLLVRVLEHEG